MHSVDNSFAGRNPDENRKTFGIREETSGRPLLVYVFGEFVLDLQQRRLSDATGSIALQFKPFQVLTFLVEHRDRVVSQEELLNLFWDGQEVYQDSLRRAVSSIRNVLKDKRENPRYLETHYRAGYRFVAAVTKLPVPACEIGQGTLEENASPGGFLQAETSTEDHPSVTSLMPCQTVTAHQPAGNLPEVERPDFVGAPIVSSLFARTSLGFRRRHLGFMTAALLVLGLFSFFLATRPSRSAHRDSIENVQALPATSSSSGFRDQGTRDSYLAAQYLLSQRSPQSIERALNAFQQIALTAPDLGDAYAGIAECYALGYWKLWKVDPELALHKSEEYALRAVKTAPASSYAHAQLAASYVRELRLAEAEAEFGDSLRLDPRNAEAHHAYAVFLDDTQRPEAGIAEMQRAIELEPLSLAYKTDLGMSYYFARRHDEAIETYRSVLRIDPRYVEAHRYLASMYAFRRDWKQAREEETFISSLQPKKSDSAAPSAVRLLTQMKTGEQKQARNEIRRLQAVPSVDNAYTLAQINAQTGESADALRFLRQVVAQHSFNALMIYADPLLDPLRDQPGFQAINLSVARIGRSNTSKETERLAAVAANPSLAQQTRPRFE